MLHVIDLCDYGPLWDASLHIIGVAFSTMDMKKPLVINRWPGTSDVANKVPTRVGYRAGSKRYVSWGFGCPEAGSTRHGIAVMDCFKLYLDPVFLRDTFKNIPKEEPWKDEDVQMWFTDFLSALHQHIIEHVGSALGYPGAGNWKSNTVEYIFSVPTTWSDSVIGTFRKVVEEAGFGEGKEYSVTIELTEAEAAAVYTAENSGHQHPVRLPCGISKLPTQEPSICEGHTLLICDSGGGTTVRTFCQTSLVASKD